MGSSWGFYMLLTEVPIYMKTMLHFNIKSVMTYTSPLRNQLKFVYNPRKIECSAECLTLPHHVGFQLGCGTVVRFHRQKEIGLN
jgi:hypothetical protein